MVKTLGFIGLGTMGTSIAHNMQAGGFAMTVFNRNPARAGALVEKGARRAPSPRASAEGADLAVTMVSDDEAVEAVSFGPDGLLEGLRKGTIHMNMTTTSVAMTRRLTEAHAARGTRFVAAPVFGRPDRAANRTLWICAAGPKDAVEECRPILAAASTQALFVLGDDPVQAAVVKIAVNFQLAAAIITMSEAFALVGKAGVKPQDFLNVVDTVQYSTPTYKAYGQRICDEAFDPAGFKMWLGLKDVRLAMAAGDALSVPLPVASVMRDHFLSGMAKGMAELDWAAISRVIRGDAGMA